jgi:DNA-binding SARP family transcriptional activator/WD40 repeat protein
MGIGVLGPLTIDGVTGSLRHHDRVVLTALAARPGDVVSADRLADALWGPEPPETWSKVIQGCVMRLRKALGADAIETTPHGYRLTLAADDVDIRRFERLAERGRELLALAEPERAGFVLDEALSLWRGQPLAEQGDWHAGRVEAARLDELRRDVEELSVDAALRSGRCREVLGRARALVDEAPLRERRWALLALAQYQSGQQAQSLRTLRQVRAVLAGELGLDPGPELVALEQAILRQDPTLVVEAALPEPSAVCPYPGLVAYGVADGDAFFGREEEVAECLRRLGRCGVLAVVGPSGSGKSSLVRAGVAASLERNGRRVLVTTPGVHPTAAMVAVPRSGPTPVLVVDQCEEALSLCESQVERDEFFTALAQHAERAPLVVALRADRIGGTTAYPAFARVVEQGLFLLGPMEPEKLRACIEGPAKQAGLRLEPGLVDLLVREVEGEPGALPLLSHALRETWAHREGRTLTVAGYQTSGGIRGAVARSAEEIYSQVSAEQQPIFRDLLLRLVAPGVEGEPARSRMPRRLVVEDERHVEVVEKLVSARLLTSDDGVLELAHEALVRAWPRFREWLEEDTEGQRILRHLTVAADTWDSMDRPESELYRGVRLGQALDWQQGARPDLTSVEQEFLAASKARVDAELTEARRRVEAERQARRRTRRLAVALGAALALALVAATGATWFQQTASDHARDAAAASTEADANRLAALSKSVRSLDLSLLLAAEALRTADTPATRDGLLASLVAHRRARQVAQLPHRPRDAVLTDRGRVLFLSLLSRVVAWRVGSSEPPTTVVRWGHRWEYIAGSPTKDLVATWSTTNDGVRVGVFDSRGQRRLLLTGFDRIRGEVADRLAFSPDGRRLLISVVSETSPGSTRVRLDSYDIASGKRVRSQLIQRTSSPRWGVAVDVSADGSTAVSSKWGETGAVALLDVGSGKSVPVRVVRRQEDALMFLALPTGAAELWRDGVVTLYDRDGREAQNLDAHRARVTDVFVSPGGTWAATADASGVLLVWDIDARTGEWTPRETLVGHDGLVADLAGSPDGRTLVSISQDGTTITWDMTADGGFGSPLSGLGDRWISNRPAVVVPGRLVVAPTRAAPSRDREWWEQRDVSAAFLDPRTGEVVDSVPAGRNGGWTFGSSASVSPDRSKVAVTYGYGTLVLDARTRDVLARIELPRIEVWGERHPEPVWCSAWTPDGTRLLLCADGDDFDPHDGNLVVVDTDTWKPRQRRVHIDGAAQTLEVSPDRRLLAVGMSFPDVDNAPPPVVGILDADTLRQVQELRLDADDFPYDLSFSPDGRRLAVGVDSGSVYTFDVASGRRLHPPAHVHNDFTQQVEWLPDGRTVVSSGSDATVTLYDADRGLVRATLPGSTDPKPAYTYLLSATDKAVTALSGERPGRTYPLDPRQWIAQACSVARRDLTRGEWSSYVHDRPYRRTCSDRA